MGTAPSCSSPNVTGPIARTTLGDPEDRRIRRSWMVFSATLVVLALVEVLRVAVEGARLIDWLTISVIVAVGLVAVRHRLAVEALEVSRRGEAESFARILQGLSRSISPDAIVDAIVEEIGSGTGADHIVVARRRPDARVLEATLVNTKTGSPSSSTHFPIGDLEDPPPLDEARAVGLLPIPLARHPLPVMASVAEQASSTRSRHSPTEVQGGAPRRHRPEVHPAVLVAERIAGRARQVYGLKHTLSAPLSTDAGVIGAIVVSRRTAEAWPASAQRILNGAAIEASAALSRAYSHREAEARASTDALTGLPNRRYFDEFCALLARRRRAEDAIGILMVDIDRFKLLNDAHGHAVGDEVLRAIAGEIAGAVREDDVPARFGGEEFAVLLRNPGLDEAVEVGERIREAVSSLDLSRFGVAAATVSVGVAVASAPDQPIVDIIEQADRALYDAKRRGRDRVVAA
jgi:diguanylate cyclase (GGDEF)-like protein